MFDLTPYNKEGLGSAIHDIAGALAQAYHENRTLVFLPVKWEVMREWRECSGSATRWECIFQPLSRCTFADLTPYETWLLQSGDAEAGETRQHVHESDSVSKANVRRTNPLLFVPPKTYEGVGDIMPIQTKAWRHADRDHQDRLWWTSSLIAYVFRLQPHIESYLRDEGRKIGWDSLQRPIVGTHIRRGESCMNKNSNWGAGFEKTCYSPHDYIKPARRLLPEPGSSVLVVGADLTAEDLQGFQTGGNWTDETFVHLQAPVYSIDRSRTVLENVNAWNAIHLSPKSILMAVRDVWFLSDCDELVLTRSSHYGQLANFLRYSRGRYKRAPIYLDATEAVAGKISLGFFHMANWAQGRDRWELVEERARQGLDIIGVDAFQGRVQMRLYAETLDTLDVPVDLYLNRAGQWREMGELSAEKAQKAGVW